MQNGASCGVTHLRRTSQVTLVLILIPFCLTGCGGDPVAPRRYDISGTVTFAGNPIPSGTISFNPHTGENGSGFATITNGRYDTQNGGRGHLGGMHTVVVTGTDGQLIAPDNPDLGTQPLFPSYEIALDLPLKVSKTDIEVPENGQ